jgi:hypothetical protein
MPERLRVHRNSGSSFDPLNVNLQPPPNETEEEKAVRLEAAREATRVSRAIDVGLVESKKALERKRRAVKILLLGQSGSGASMYSEAKRLPFAGQSESGKVRRAYTLSWCSLRLFCCRVRCYGVRTLARIFGGGIA